MPTDPLSSIPEPTENDAKLDIEARYSLLRKWLNSDGFEMAALRLLAAERRQREAAEKRVAELEAERADLKNQLAIAMNPAVIEEIIAAALRRSIGAKP
jgi:hypothetical protein